jgi:PAS domain S-box-containing protein
MTDRFPSDVSTDELRRLQERVAALERALDEQKLAEEALRESEERYRGLFEGSPYPMLIYDWETLRFLGVNDAAVEFYGYPRAEFLQLTLPDLHPAEDLLALHAHLQGNPPVGKVGVWRHRRKDGTVLDVEIFAHYTRFGRRKARFVLAHDISEQKRAEQALRRAEERYRNIFENATEGIFQTTPDGRYLRANPALARINGYASADELVREVADIAGQIYVDPARRDEFLRRMRQQGYVKDFEYRLRRKDGQIIWVSENARAVYDDRGRIVCFEGTVQDISERKRAEEDLQRTNQTLKALIAASPLAILAIDPNGLVQSWNQAAERIFGWSEAEVLGKPSPLSPPALREQSLALRRRVLAGESFADFQTRRQRKDGTLIDVSISAAPLYDAQGQVSGIMAVVADITARKQAEEALRESEERFRQMAENIREVFWMTDPKQTRYYYVSPAFEAIWGRPRQHVYHQPYLWIDAIDPQDRQRVLSASAQASGGYDVEYRVIRPDGSVRWIWDRAFPIKDSAGRVYRLVGIAEDITEHKRLEEQLVHAQKMEAVGRLAGGVAHEFNNLLTVILGYSDMVLSQLSPADPSREMVGIMKQAGERAARLTRQLLAFSRKQLVKPKLLDLNTIADAMDAMLRRLIGEDIRLVTQPSPRPAWIRADPGQVEQVIMNLIVNARDAMPDGGQITLQIQEVTLDADAHPDVRPGCYVMLAVRDTGLGMDAETKLHLFEPFFTTKEVGKGTGLGLATVYGIVKQNDGHIEVESEPGSGSVFRVFLPRVEPSDTEDKTDTTIRKSPMGNETVLLVEDEDTVRALAKDSLEKCGYTVLAASQGEEALELSARHPGAIHLLLADVVMPGMGGRQLAERLAADRPGLKVLYMSGYLDDEIVRLGVLEANTPFLHKPFKPVALARTVREVLDGWR